jgi:hypothetical protein
MRPGHPSVLSMTPEEIVYGVIIILFLFLLFVQVHIFHHELTLRFDQLDDASRARSRERLPKRPGSPEPPGRH